MSRAICNGRDLYDFINFLGQYKALDIIDCDVLVKIALEWYHAQLYITETNFLIYDCWDGCFCVNPMSLCNRLKNMLLEELKLSPDKLYLRHEIAQLYAISKKEKMICV